MLDHSCQPPRHAIEERGADLYETPAVAVDALLRVLPLPAGGIWEPACGRGAIANILRAHGHVVVCTDLVDYGADSTATYGVDFLKATEVPAGVTSIVTNSTVLARQRVCGTRAHAVPDRGDAPPVGILGIGAAIANSGWRRAEAGLRVSQAPTVHASQRLDRPARQLRPGIRLVHLAPGLPGHMMTRRISWEDDRDAQVLLPQGQPVNGSHRSHSVKRGANRAYVLARLRRDGRADLIQQVESGLLSVRGALAAITGHKQASR